MSGTDQQITDALRGIAEQAAAPRQMAAAAWRSRRRRRLLVMATSATAAAGAVAVAVAVTADGPARTPPAAPTALISLRSPIQFRQVATIGATPCGAGSGGLPGNAPPPPASA